MMSADIGKTIRIARKQQGLRHDDHRFEWTRAEFERWAAGVCDRNGYVVSYEGIGEAHPELGHPTQMAVFEQSNE